MPEVTEKRQEILELLANGKVSAAEAAAMLASADQPQKGPREQAEQPTPAEKEPGPDDAFAENVDSKSEFEPSDVAKNGGSRPSWLRVRVSDARTGKNRVTVNVPLRLVRYGLAIGRRYAPEVDELDWDEISNFIAGEKGMLVDVLDEEDGEHVQIFVD